MASRYVVLRWPMLERTEQSTLRGCHFCLYPRNLDSDDLPVLFCGSSSEEDTVQTKCSMKASDLEKRLMFDLIPLELLPLLKGRIKESAIVFGYRSYGKLMPFGDTEFSNILDHWSPEDQGMVSFIHLAKSVKASDIGGYADAILDACCQFVACDDELWI